LRCNKLTAVTVAMAARPVRARLATSLAAIVAAVLAAGEACAFLDTGTLLTNSASATYAAGAPGSYQQSSISYSATAKILVANPAVFLWKDIDGPTCVTASAGGTIAFSICFSNGGANSAFNITVKDKLPNATWWISLANYSSWWIDLAGVGQTLTTYYSQSATTGVLYPVGAGQNMCPSATCPFLQWVVPALGVGRSGCVSFTVSVW